MADYTGNTIQIWKYFLNQGYTKAGAAAILGNMQAESGLNPNCLQIDYRSALGYTSESYTKAVDSGTYSKSKFCYDQAGYGLVQWTYWSRKEFLYDFAKTKGTSISNLSTQVLAVDNELQTNGSFKSIYSLLTSSNDVSQCAGSFFSVYEGAAGGEVEKQKRISYAKNIYNSYVNSDLSSVPSLVNQATSENSLNIPQLAVNWAVKTASDSSHGYNQGSRWGPDYDCSSLVISSYVEAGTKVKDNGATYTVNMRTAFLKSGFSDITSQITFSTYANMQTGDVLLCTKSHTALYIGNGKLVHAAGDENGRFTGGTPGDQTGHEIEVIPYFNYPWDCILRYTSTDASISYNVDSEEVSNIKSSLSSIVDQLVYDESESLKKLYGSYSEYIKAMQLKYGGGAVSESEPIVGKRFIAQETPNAISASRFTSLLSTPTLVESPFITLTIGKHVFGTYSSKKSNNRVTVEYPNYMDSINITKVNGTVNQYVIQMTYQIQPGQDPNLLDKIFSSVGYGTVKISYGDYSSPSFIYRDEEAIITKLTSKISFATSSITYVLSCTSNSLSLIGNSFTFDARTGVKPSDRIIELLFSSQYGLQNIFTGMSNKTIARSLIASDDCPVDLTPKVGLDPLSYLNYLVSCMSSAGEVTTELGKSTYYLSIVDDVTNSYGGPYFKVTKVTANSNAESLSQADVYEVNVGYSGYLNDTQSSLVMSFDIDNDDSWSLLYKYSGNIGTNNYVYNIDNNGNVTSNYSPNILTSSSKLKTTQVQKTWWTQMTQFPITATLTLKGLLRPAMLMSYVRINALFYGQRHTSSGLYIITKQEDTVDSSGYRTKLTLTRVTGDNKFETTVSNYSSTSTGLSTGGGGVYGGGSGRR